MESNLEKLLNITSVEDYSEIQGAEYLFHEALNHGSLKRVIDKFPCSMEVYNLLEQKILNFSGLTSGWDERLLSDVNELINLLPTEKLSNVNEAIEGDVDYDTDEMFILRGEMGKIIRKNSNSKLSGHERAFLNDFFYGVDFTHWTKWAVLLSYTDLGLKLPNVILARRNDIDFCIDKNILIYKKNNKK